MQETMLYRTLRMDNTFELREYQKVLLAKAIVKGPFESAYRAGKELFRDYSEGNNYKRERLTIHPALCLISQKDGWEVSCVLPSHFSMTSSPRPMGEKIQFQLIPNKIVALIKFHGKAGYPTLMRKTDELRSWAKNYEIPVEKTSRILIYQTAYLPFMRRNEIHFDAFMH